MKWHVYKKNDPNTWPQIDCPMLVYDPYKQYNDSPHNIFICRWNNDIKQFYTPMKLRNEKELYYAYIGYVPSGYKTLYPTKCICEDRCLHGYDDDGYCMSGRTFACKYKRDVAEYSIDEEPIWKEFK